MLSFQENHTVNQMGYPTSWQSILNMLNKNTSSITYSALNSSIKCSLPPHLISFHNVGKKSHTSCVWQQLQSVPLLLFRWFMKSMTQVLKAYHPRGNGLRNPADQQQERSWEWDEFSVFYITTSTWSKQQKSCMWHKQTLK